MRNKKILKTIKNSTDFIVLLLLTFLISFFYLCSANNLTGMLDGDGYTHSLIAENIYKTGSINYEMPYKLFTGAKIDNKPTHSPVGYTQFYHLALATFNNILNLNLFSPAFSILINILNTSLIYLILKRNKYIRFIIPFSILLFTSHRSLFINFIEPFLLTMFLCAIFFISKLSLQKKEKEKLWLLGFASYFLGCFAVTKHLGLFDGTLITALLFVYFLIKKKFKFSIIAIFIFITVASVPLCAQLKGVGSLGYGVGTLAIPKYIPFSDLISNYFFNSKFQPLTGLPGRKLSYQRDTTIKENIILMSNYFNNFGYNIQSKLNLLALLLIFISTGFILKKNSLVGIVLIAVFASEFFFLNFENLRITQYNIVLTSLFFFLLFYPVQLLFTLPQFSFINKKIYWLLFVTLLVLRLSGNFISLQHKRIFANMGRWNPNQEKLYETVSLYLKENEEFTDKVFLASDIQFGYHTKRDYIWFSPLFYEGNNEDEIDKYLELVKNYFDAEYFLLSSVNFRNRGLYDHIPQKSVEFLENNKKIELIKEFKEGEEFIKIYRLL